jgi:23S rRNA pseudouridine2457 synthase
MLIAFHKPYGVICQFRPTGTGCLTLAEFGFPPGVYSLGRLDADSEGLLLLGDEPGLNQELLNPRRQHPRTYWAQVEGTPDPRALRRLESGVTIQGRRTLPCRAWVLVPQPEIPPRCPPIRFRKSVPACWMAVELVQGKNRQVRRMTAAVGHPTLRLLRVGIGAFGLGELQPGHWKALTDSERALVFRRPGAGKSDAARF